jgi:predicted ArsR family transcriptional regulator
MKRAGTILKDDSSAARPTADRVLLQIKMRGSQTALELGTALDMTDEAARQHLVKMAGDGLVESRFESRGVGRPKQLWSLTAAGNGRFPDAHADLTVQLISTIRSALGEEALDRLIAAREKEVLTNYQAEMEGAEDLKARVKRLAAIRDREGYMCELKKDADGYLLIENHCPICAAATACQGFCQAELRTFKRVLGDHALVTREEHIVSGARRCAYRIKDVARAEEGESGDDKPSPHRRRQDEKTRR